LVLCQGVSAAQESKEFALVFHHHTCLSEEAELAERVASDRSPEAGVAKFVELLPQWFAATTLQVGVPMENITVEVVCSQPNLLR
jgi:hypothetical protein